MLFFLFKQKTAYEMRISDWSSDVCSSDLHHLGPGERRLGIDDPALLADRREVPQESEPFGEMREAAKESELAVIVQRAQPGQEQASEQGTKDADREQEGGARGYPARSIARRSEEHTSELQSLMRMWYAVFCWR